jgi:hypothetical protein
MMVPLEEILRRLSEIEKEEDVTVFYACESGSRAWGFPSEDSDYDVRFLYLRQSNWYLSIDVEEKRDVIERPINDLLDISGWDLRKALKLLLKSNPPLQLDRSAGITGKGAGYAKGSNPVLSHVTDQEIHRRPCGGGIEANE